MKERSGMQAPQTLVKGERKVSRKEGREGKIGITGERRMQGNKELKTEEGKRYKERIGRTESRHLKL